MLVICSKHVGDKCLLLSKNRLLLSETLLLLTLYFNDFEEHCLYIVLISAMSNLCVGILYCSSGAFLAGKGYRQSGWH